MSYLLDTHAAIWLLEGSPKLGTRGKRAIERAAPESIGISDISLFETAMLVARGKVRMATDSDSGVAAFSDHLSVYPINAEIAFDAATVGLPHRDPFDRIILATARVYNLTLITKDATLQDSDLVRTLW